MVGWSPQAGGKPMPLTLTADEHAALHAAQVRSRTVRHWRRFQAVLLRAERVPVATLAQTLDCTQTSVHNWVAAWRAAGGEVWFGDETTLREYPPLRAGWARRGEQGVVVISGRNARRVVHGARNAATGEFVALVRERSRQDDCAAFVEALGQVRPAVPKLLVWDNAPPHHPRRVVAAAQAAHSTLAFLPFPAPELMPCEDLWRLTKAVVAANRAYEAVPEPASQAIAWLAALAPFDRLLKSGLFGTKFQWLST